MSSNAVRLKRLFEKKCLYNKYSSLEYSKRINRIYSISEGINYWKWCNQALFGSYIHFFSELASATFTKRWQKLFYKFDVFEYFDGMFDLHDSLRIPIEMFQIEYSIEIFENMKFVK